MREKIGHYTIVSELGRGGMGIVYKAHEESLNRFVAIKVLTEKLTEDDTFLQRFVREAKAAAGVSHPNIVQIFFIGEDEGHPYFVMEYVTGRSLSQMVRSEGRIGNPRAAQLILQAAHGLAAAHDKGIVHRDIKPANLMLDERGMVKIADFGLALPADAESRLTATGMMVGTPGYLAPEQCRGEKIDHRTDIYALGVTFYELLAGAPPFRGESPLALLRQILDEQPPDIGSLNPSVDAETRRILGKMIEKDREQRYQSCHDIVADLEEYLAQHGVRSVTAGLSTRTPTASELAAAAAAQDAATQAVSDMKTAQTLAPSNAPTEVVPSVEPKTQPDLPYVAPPTAPPTARPSAAPAAPAGTYMPVVAMAPPPRSSSRALIIAIVLVLLIGASLAAAYVGLKFFRDRKAASGQIAALQSTPAPAAARAAATGANTANMTGTTPPGVLLNNGVANPIEGSGGVPPASSQASATHGGLVAASTPTRGNGGAQNTANGSLAAPNSGGGRPQGSGIQSPDRQQGVDVHDPAAGRGSRASGVAVAVTGDQALVGPVSSVLTSELEAAGVQAIDAQTLPATEDLVRRGDVSAARLIDRLRGEGVAMLLLARVEPIGQRELYYLGRSDTAYSARITLTTYDLSTGRPVGSSRSATIEYTSRTAERESEKVLGPLARSVSQGLEKK
jgi:eukaryotic-like serine/threonine-protein kinase